MVTLDGSARRRHFFEAFANHPDLFPLVRQRILWSRVSRWSRRSTLQRASTPRLSTLHGCRFCNQGNRADASAAGFSDEEIDAITDMSSDVFQGADKAVLS